jgi:1-deoxyxylulose-5-phosphate synthase
MQVTRRDFLKTTAAAASAAAGLGGLAAPALAAKRSATDMVTLGKSGVQVTRLAFGTGTFSGKTYRDLGQDLFTRMARHAYDRGIRWFETADGYDQMHEWLAVALKGIPRDSYVLSSKLRFRAGGEEPSAIIDRIRKELGTEYLDILLIHAVRTATWSQEQKQLRDALSEAKSKKIVRAIGVSNHGLLPLRSHVGNDWPDVALVRVNHNGTRMDALDSNSSENGNVEEVVSLLKKVHAQGTGVLGMKLCGEGSFPKAEDREASLKFVMNLGTVDAVTIGYQSTAQIDEAIERINRNLNA